MRRIIFLGIGFICGLIILFNPKPVFSKEEVNAIDSFSYEIVYPDSQGNKNLGYFDFKMVPSSQQRITIKLNNSGSEELKVLVQLNSAKTNSSGKIEYGPSEIGRDESVNSEIADMVKVPKEVRIPSKGSNTLELVVDLPDKLESRILLGGIQLQPLGKGEAPENTNQSVVTNEFSYIIGLLIRVGETNKIKPSLKFNRLYTSFRNGESHLIFNYSNTQGVILEGMDVSVTLRKRNKQESLFDHTQTGMRMAPNSMIDFPVELADKGLNAGEYTAQIIVKDQEKNSWSWISDFTLSSFEVSAMMNREVDEVKQPVFIRILLVVLLAIFLIGIVIKLKVMK